MLAHSPTSTPKTLEKTSFNQLCQEINEMLAPHVNNVKDISLYKLHGPLEQLFKNTCQMIKFLLIERDGWASLFSAKCLDDENSSLLFFDTELPDDKFLPKESIKTINQRFPGMNASYMTRNMFDAELNRHNMVEALQEDCGNMPKLQLPILEEMRETAEFFEGEHKCETVHIIKLNTKVFAEQLLPQLQELAKRSFSHPQEKVEAALKEVFTQENTDLSNTNIFTETLFYLLKDNAAKAQQVSKSLKFVMPRELQKIITDYPPCHAYTQVEPLDNFKGFTPISPYHYSITANASTLQLAFAYFNNLLPSSCVIKNEKLIIETGVLTHKNFLEDIRTTLRDHPEIIKKYKVITELSSLIEVYNVIKPQKKLYSDSIQLTHEGLANSINTLIQSIQAGNHELHLIQSLIIKVKEQQILFEKKYAIPFQPRTLFVETEEETAKIRSISCKNIIIKLTEALSRLTKTLEAENATPTKVVTSMNKK